MRLVPVSKSLAIVAKLDEQDPDAARTFLQLALYESMCDQSDAARAEVEPYVLAKMADTLVIARKTLLRNHVGKSIDARGNSEDLAYAQGMAMLETHIEKGLGSILSGVTQALFNRQHPRGPGGRWVDASIGDNTSGAQAPSESQSGLHAEAASKVARWQGSRLIDEHTPIVMQHRRVDGDGHPIGGSDGVVTNPTTAPQMGEHLRTLEDRNPDSLRLERIYVNDVDRPDGGRGNSQQRVALDIMSAAMGGDRGMGRRLMNGLPSEDSADNNTAGRKWNAPSNPENGRQSYRRMSMTGNLLSNISAPGSTLDTVGGLAQLIGNMGPEAEKILGPGIRRTAYRYRGTEKRPDRAMLRGVREATAAADSLDYNHYKGGNDAGEAKMNSIKRGRTNITSLSTPNGGLSGLKPADKSTPRSQMDPVAMTNRYWMDENVSEDFRTLGMRGDAAVVNLLDALPTKELTELGVASGELPPSQGVIINADGKVVTQAMGYNGDHYLPFDLKNLNALHGGQYVRTRAAGGLTTEDIYTGLLTGARQVQVVSNSGVFTLEFDPDLRGGRRYSDKAARMISRYGKLLETIVNQKIYQNDLPPEQIKTLKQQALKLANGDEERYGTILNRLKGDARLVGSIEGEDDEEELTAAADFSAKTAFRTEMEARSSRKLPPMSTSERASVMDEARQNFLDQNKGGIRRLVLDGPGYERALKTLKQEFPFYIRQAKWESLPAYLRARRIPNTKEFRRFYPKDTGHVTVGQVHALRNDVPTSVNTATRTPDLAETPVVNDRSIRSVRDIGAPVAQPVAAALTGRTPFMDKLTTKVKQTFMVLLNHELPVQPSVPLVGVSPREQEDDMAMSNQADVFVRWKLEQLGLAGGPEQIGAKFAAWLVDPAVPRMVRDKAVSALPAAVGHAEKFDFGVDPAAVEAAASELHGYLDIAEPFATAEDDPVMAMPDQEHPKPQQFSDIPFVTGRKAYDDYLSDQFGVNRPFVAAVEDLTSRFVVNDDNGAAVFDDDGVGEEIITAIYAVNAAATPERAEELHTDLAAKQKAWSFLKARHAGTVLGRTGNLAGGAVPFEKGTAEAPRRVITFYKDAHQFGRMVRDTHKGL